jgi:uncharacterized protein (TIGR02569 family)
MLQPPPPSVLSAFGVDKTAIHLKGGQGTTWRAASIVLKPSGSLMTVNWIAAIFDGLAEQQEFRFARPVKSAAGHWVENGWVAWNFIEGDVVKGHYKEKFAACEAFHKAIAHIPCPDFIKGKNDPWSIADRVAWQEREIEFHPDFLNVISQIQTLLKPLSLPSQAVHGDMLGNFLFADKKSPAIIDFSPAWRPAGFAKGVMIADAIAWESAGVDIFSLTGEAHLGQLILRGAFRRIVEQQEHMTQSGKKLDEALRDVKAYEKVILLLEESSIL